MTHKAQETQEQVSVATYRDMLAIRRQMQEAAYQMALVSARIAASARYAGRKETGKERAA